MRPFLATLIVATILLGLQLYMVTRPAPSTSTVALELDLAQGRFEVETTLTFDAGPDAFALDLSDAPSLLVQLGGRDLARRTDTVAAGEAVVVDQVEGLVTGRNEFFVQATPQASDAIARAVRVRVLRDGQPIADQTLWSEPGEAVVGTVPVDIPEWVELPADVEARS